MGKAALILGLGGMLMISMTLFKAERAAHSSTEVQSQRDEEVLAREIARSGYNAIRSKVTQVTGTGYSDMDDLVSKVNGPTGKIQGSYQGGTYEASIEGASAEAYLIHVIGRYGKAEHEIYGPSNHSNGHIPSSDPGGDPEVEEPKGPLVVPRPSKLRITFLESMAGYCSAIYLQRIPPARKSNNGHGNNADGVDSSNPGKSKQGQDTDPTVDDEMHELPLGPNGLPIPESIFPPGNNRDGYSADYETIIPAGWRINFILAVDDDYNCEKRDVHVQFGSNTFRKTFGYWREALLANVEDLSDMQEGSYAMIQSNPYREGVWRIAFEDLYFSDEQLADVKKNGYGTTQWRTTGKGKNKKGTYGGSGWHQRNAAGYYLLKDYGHMPDFSDQVIEVELIDPNDPGVIAGN